MKSRNYVFTINNYTSTILSKFKVLSESLEKHSYICFGLEQGEKGTKHIQGYVQLTENMRFTGVQKYFNIQKKKKLDKFHLQPAKGDLKQNQTYTKKQDKWFEYGKPRDGQGSRTDISDIRDKMREDPSKIRKILKGDDLNYQQLRYVETYSKYVFPDRSLATPPKVFWIWGDSGKGKTRKVFTDFKEEDIFSANDYNWLGDNYYQEKVFLLDDFRQHDMKFNQLLKICDRYPLSLPVKGSFIPLNSEYIIITSNKSLEETYSYLEEKEDLKQIRRRVNVYHISEISDTHFKDLYVAKDNE